MSSVAEGLIVPCVQMDGCSSFDRLSTERQVCLEHQCLVTGCKQHDLQLSLFHSLYSAVGGVFGLQAAWPEHEVDCSCKG